LCDERDFISAVDPEIYFVQQGLFSERFGDGLQGDVIHCGKDRQGATSKEQAELKEKGHKTFTFYGLS